VTEQALPPERYGAFLLVRRGLPLAGMLLGLLAALVHAPGRGWWTLGAAACFGALWPNLKRGAAYLAARPAILRADVLVVHLFRPLARLLGREDAWILSFCAWNNHRVREVFEARPARRALVLLPHCIQLAKCRAEVLDDLQACYDCGLCPVGDLMHAVLERSWESRITNRSYKAYREAREHRPDLVVAVSCTDRLLKGIAKLSDVPAYVLPLDLPHGMCVDTQFRFQSLLAAMGALVEPRRVPEVLDLDRTGVA
jgi:uncharacterized protein